MRTQEHEHVDRDKREGHHRPAPGGHVFVLDGDEHQPSPKEFVFGELAQFSAARRPRLDSGGDATKVTSILIQFQRNPLFKRRDGWGVMVTAFLPVSSPFSSATKVYPCAGVRAPRLRSAASRPSHPQKPRQTCRLRLEERISPTKSLRYRDYRTTHPSTPAPDKCARRSDSA